MPVRPWYLVVVVRTKKDQPNVLKPIRKANALVAKNANVLAAISVNALIVRMIAPVKIVNAFAKASINVRSARTRRISNRLIRNRRPR